MRLMAIALFVMIVATVLIAWIDPVSGKPENRTKAPGKAESPAPVSEALDISFEGTPPPIPRPRTRSSLLEDVTLALKEAEDSGLVAVRTSAEKRILRSWRAKLAAEGSSGVPILAGVRPARGEPRDRSQAVFEVSARLGEPLGRIRVRRQEGRWRLLEVVDFEEERKERRRLENAYGALEGEE